MRLAFIHPSLKEQGGAENYLVTTMIGLASRGHHIDLFTADYDESLYPAIAQAPYGVTLLCGRGYMEGIGGTRRLARQLTRLLGGYDLLIPGNFPAHLWVGLGKHAAPILWLCQEPKRNLYPQIMYAEAPGTKAWGYRTRSDYKGISGTWRLLTHDPHVLLPYWMRSGLQRFLDQYAVKHIQTILTNTPYTAEKIHQIYPKASIQVIWVGLPLPEVDDQHEKIILVPTRLEPIKNVDVVLRAAHLLKTKNGLDDYQIVIMGGGSERANLQDLCKQLDLDDFVSFTGFVSNAERDAYYARCAMVIYPSLAEPLGLPCIEAGLSAKAVIASDKGGPATIIQHEKTGLLVDMTEPEALAEAVARMVMDIEACTALGKAARLYLEPLCGLENWIQKLESTLTAFRTRGSAGAAWESSNR